MLTVHDKQEEYGTNEIATFPLVHAAAGDGSALTVRVECRSDVLHARVWLAHVGRARLLLLDSNVDANPPHLRELTATRYGGDQRTRIRQEILLGIGGPRALRALGIRPSILHLNEGHRAFAILERVRERVEDDGLAVEQALRATALQTIFTTHTPVEAGHDRFGADVVEQELGWLRRRLGLDQGRFMALGQVDAANAHEPFCMTVLGLKGSRWRNGVSSLHGHVHPRDDDGKRLSQQIVELSRDRRFAGRVVLVDDYDMNVARHLVQGVDVWLNTRSDRSRRQAPVARRSR